MCLDSDRATLDSWRDTNSLVYSAMLVITGDYFPNLRGDVRHVGSWAAPDMIVNNLIL
jgi:hypothetical protein